MKGGRSHRDLASSSGAEGRCSGERTPGRRTLVELAHAPVQAKRARAAAGEPGAIRDVAAEGVEGGGESPLPHLDRIQASFGPEHDVSRVRAHVGGAAATAAGAIGAAAYAMGDRVAFQAAPDLHTAAHEAAHVVQQRGGVVPAGGVGAAGDAHERHADEVADRVVRGESSAALLGNGAGAASSAAGLAPVQMRRVPGNLGALLSDPADPSLPAPNFDAAAEGTLLLLQRTVGELSPAEVAAVQTAMLGGMSLLDFLHLPPPEILTRMSTAVLTVRPDLTLGDPNLIDTGPRPGTDDRANLNQLVRNAKRILDTIISGSRNADLGQVFGNANRAEARRKYASARRWMRRLQRRDRIVTDRSGYNDEVFLGGLTGYHSQIALHPGTIDNPDDPEAIVILIHEAMHAGNNEVDDKGYIHQPSFTELAEDVKLTNAAHFEVVPRRMLGMPYAFDGVTFVPAGTTVGGVTAPPLTATEEAIRGASEAFRRAWTIALNLHALFNRVYGDPSQWTRDLGGGRSYRGSFPYWSKVEKMTIHLKTDIDPTSSNPARHPVSQIDMALSEGLTRRIGFAMDLVPQNETDAATFEAAHSTDSERTAARASVDSHKTFLMQLALRQPQVQPMTGTPERDLRVVQEFVNLDWGTVLQTRNPDDFAD